MYDIINKLVKFLTDCEFHTDYNPDAEEKSHFSILIRSDQSNIEYYLKVAEVSWSSDKIILTYMPGIAPKIAAGITMVFDNFNPNK